ncbi:MULTISPECIES: polysaccharide lyase family 8 super-sandwich domain-containing protein [Lacticaseibacillus]|uniref:Polysaccharide lyase n=2 Tax=Lacticaseibacillus TaxID=2759736 RepID=A0AAN1KFD6_LACCA|nr:MULTISPECIES: polysaccharide lyase family 8 super-sandwich domain-containing protein [Lacticaseibacillus]ARY92677.1 polysaccharide lyase [Lacticaseibacillus casei]KAB1969483.1 LPXTG cell wall anchor domain-containing protein [Lacticaseibacillus casei]WLV80577.1 polysaccharide lyase family 8 super-sandwich domain-containing protein [Lacticaseibacillus sp. NCIMB 15473]WNX24538.1 polysaccharide lyase family 8 super-sandwich domain-containing protein [Lacticaseibacillus casei]WNX27310.1 polysac
MRRYILSISVMALTLGLIGLQPSQASASDTLDQQSAVNVSDDNGQDTKKLDPNVAIELPKQTAVATSDEQTARPEYALMRTRWRDRLMAAHPDLNNPNVTAYLTDLAKQSQTLWDTMDRSAGRTRLWPKKAADTTSADYTTMFTNLKLLTLGYYNPLSAQYQKTEVYQAILDGIDFMITIKKYNGVYSTGNWWDWQIGAAQQLDDTLILLYDDLHQQDQQKLVKFVQPLLGYAKDPNIQWPKYTATGANLTDISISVLASGLLLENDTRVALVQKNLPKAMGLVTSKDGIYADGSFIQHTFFPYNGSYGNEMIKGIARISSTLVGTPWAISEVQFANVFNLIDKGFLQLMVNGRMPSMVSGRSISRAPGTNSETTELETGKETLANLTLIADAAPATLKQKIYQVVATWVGQVGKQYNFYHNPRDYATLNGLQTALSHASAQPDDVSSLNVYGSMDRVMQKTPTHSVGIAMYSKRIANFEFGNTENGHAWHTADGMLYLYNRDLNQFGEGYWTTVDPYRLPGTTVDTIKLADGAKSSSRSPESWVGGATDGLTASVGMSLNKVNEGQNLKAKKSWFLLNDQVVNLGANITGTTTADIETILDQRQIDPAATKITVDGHAYTSQKTVGQWANLNTADPANNVGYIVAPGNSPVNISQATRTGTYKDINGYFPSDTVYRHHYVTLAAMHGSAVNNGHYEYVTVPGASDTKIAALAKDPAYQVLANTGDVQAIKTENQLMANIWTKASQLDGLVSVEQPAAVVIKNLGSNRYQLTIADPQQTNQPIHLDFDYPVQIDGDDAVNFSTNGHRLVFEASGLAGASRTVTFTLDVPADKTDLDNVIKQAEQMKAADYTKTSFAAFATALTAAKEVQSSDNVSQKVVDAAKAKLVDAMNALVKAADKHALAAALADAAKLNEKDYTDDTWQNLQIAIAAAKQVLSQYEPTQTEVDKVTQQLRDAQANLVKIGKAPDIEQESGGQATSAKSHASQKGQHQPKNGDEMPETGETSNVNMSFVGVAILGLIAGAILWQKQRRV